MQGSTILLLLSTIAIKVCQTTDNLDKRAIAPAESDIQKLEIDSTRMHVTIEPIRNGAQRALFNEVAHNVIDQEELSETNGFETIPTYDEVFAEPVKERPLQIPIMYRGKLIEELPESSEMIAHNVASNEDEREVKKTSKPNSQMLSKTSTARQEAVTKAHILNPKQPISRPASGSQSGSHQQPPLNNRRPGRVRSQQTTFPAPRQRITTPFPFASAAPPQVKRPPQASRPKQSQQPPRINLQQDESERLRTSVCRGMMRYMTTYAFPRIINTVYTHYAITVSVDQCARTCYEFNCWLAYYNPWDGRCQFNPSTPNHVMHQQCPDISDTRYTSDVHSNQRLSIYCIRCYQSAPRRLHNDLLSSFRGRARSISQQIVFGTKISQNDTSSIRNMNLLPKFYSKASSSTESNTPVIIRLDSRSEKTDHQQEDSLISTKV